VTFAFTVLTIAVNAIYLLLNLDHLRIDTFVVAYTLAMAITALGFVAYAEIVVWRTIPLGRARQKRT
jgi:hypothetical protein